MRIEIERNPAGYSPGTYGYVIRDACGDPVHHDGGYASEQHAREAGRDTLSEAVRDSLWDIGR